MEKLAIGLWGFFYGGSVLVLCGAVFAYSRSMHRIGINAGWAAVGPAFALSAFSGILPINDQDTLLRLLALLTAAVAGLLVYQLLNILGELQTPVRRSRTKVLFVLAGTAAMAIGWTLSPPDALLMCGLIAFIVTLYAWGVSFRKALRGDSVAWVAIVTVGVIVSSFGCLLYGVLYPERWTWKLQAIAAACASAYIIALAGINWVRYSYLLESQKIMEYGPAYDPITRMRSRSETSVMARGIFNQKKSASEPLGVIVLTIANLYSLEKLHGTAAVNSALFLIAGRLKRALPARVEIGRLGFDGFLLIMHNCRDCRRLINLAQDITRRLHKSATLNTNPAVQQLESAQTVWQAQVGLGVLQITHLETTSLDAITMGRNMSHAAISYPSRIAWFDHASGEMTELPSHPGMV